MGDYIPVIKAEHYRVPVEINWFAGTVLLEVGVATRSRLRALRPNQARALTKELIEAADGRARRRFQTETYP